MDGEREREREREREKRERWAVVLPPPVLALNLVVEPIEVEEWMAILYLKEHTKERGKWRPRENGRHACNNHQTSCPSSSRQF